MSLGECYFCGSPLTAKDEVTMIKSGMRPDYAHKECVPRLLRDRIEHLEREIEEKDNYIADLEDEIENKV